MEDIIRKTLKNKALKIMKQNSRSIGTRLRSFRKELGMKGYEFAKMIKISQGSLSDIENCKSNPSAETIAKIATKTNCDIYWLLTGKTDNKNKIYIEGEV